MGFAQLRSAIAKALEPTGLYVYEHEHPNPQTPCLMLASPRIDYLKTMRTATTDVGDSGICDVEMPLHLILPAGMGDQAPSDSDQWLDPSGPKSVFALLMTTNDPPNGGALGGVCDSITVNTYEPRGPEDWAGLPYYGGMWPLAITARRNA